MLFVSFVFAYAPKCLFRSPEHKDYERISNCSQQFIWQLCNRIMSLQDRSKTSIITVNSFNVIIPTALNLSYQKLQLSRRQCTIPARQAVGQKETIMEPLLSLTFRVCFKNKRLMRDEMSAWIIEINLDQWMVIQQFGVYYYRQWNEQQIRFIRKPITNVYSNSLLPLT